jgi:hypothetical protein
MKIRNPFRKKESNLKKGIKALLSVMLITATYIIAWVIGGLIGRKAGELITATTEEETPESLVKQGIQNFQKAVEKVA